MDLAYKIVDKIPLYQLWNSECFLNAKREHFLSKEEIKQLLRNDKVKFVIANVGDDLNWIAKEDNFEVWKNKLINNIAKYSDENYLENFPNDYFYFASKWKVQDHSKDIIILFEKYH